MTLTMRRGWLWWQVERDIHVRDLYHLRQLNHKGWRLVC